VKRIAAAVELLTTPADVALAAAAEARAIGRHEWAAPETLADLLDAGLEIREVHACTGQTLVRTLDPELDHRSGRSIPPGDDCCEQVLGRRRG
jgi:hypothetical protein